MGLTQTLTEQRSQKLIQLKRKSNHKLCLFNDVSKEIILEDTYGSIEIPIEGRLNFSEFEIESFRRIENLKITDYPFANAFSIEKQVYAPNKENHSVCVEFYKIDPFVQKELFEEEDYSQEIKMSVQQELFSPEEYLFIIKEKIS